MRTSLNGPGTNKYKPKDDIGKTAQPQRVKAYSPTIDIRVSTNFHVNFTVKNSHFYSQYVFLAKKDNKVFLHLFRSYKIHNKKEKELQENRNRKGKEKE